MIPHCPGSFSSLYPSLTESNLLKNYGVKKKEEEAEEKEEEGNLCQSAKAYVSLMTFLHLCHDMTASPGQNVGG